MDIKITNEQENPLYKRKEIFGTITDKSTPSKTDVAKFLSEKYSVPSNALRVLEIQGKFGTNEFFMRANIYPSVEERDDIEKMSKKEKDQEAKANEKPVEEAPAEEAPAKAEQIPAVEETGSNPVEEAKEAESKEAEEDKKEKDKPAEEKVDEAGKGRE